MISWRNRLRSLAVRSARRADARVGGRLSKLGSRMGYGARFRGHVDGETDSQLNGWAVNMAKPNAPVSLGLFVDGTQYASTTTSAFRGDVKDAGFGNGKCGFSFEITEALRRVIDTTESRVSIYALDDKPVEIGTYQFEPAFEGNINDDTGLTKTLRAFLFSDLEDLAHVPGIEPMETPLDATRETSILDKLFDPLKLPGQPSDGAVIPAYVDFSRYRIRVDEVIDPHQNSDDMAHLLEWYITAYATNRDEYRVPLSHENIAFCNEPIVMGGQAFSLSRIMWWRLVRTHHLRETMDLSDPKWFEAFCYWWARTEAHVLRVEDCMVPDSTIRVMRSISMQRRMMSYPLTAFMARYLEDTPALSFMSAHREKDRILLALILMVQAINRPDFLRYLPDWAVKGLLKPAQDGGAPAFVQFCNGLLGTGPDSGFSSEKYKAALRDRFFDIDSLSFTLRTANDDRLHSAGLPVPTGDKVDVQMIGPFGKASGLGQATRLSGEIMGHTEFSFNAVDFGLDNPAPEGFSTQSAVSSFRPAEVNIIHLNAESIPLAFAYGPNVFDGAYNIGYFFWELDSPAMCHYLSLELLDEIWVSTEYGVQIYQPHTEKPVTNVGMSFEHLPQIDREDARQFLASRFHFSKEDFVFFVAFDSYSFVQRKNPLGVLQAFQKAFEGAANARLLIKTQNRDNVSDPVQAKIWAAVDAIMAKDSRIKLMNETLAYRDVLRLKKGCDCYLSLHKSEGWGFGMIEAMGLGVPVVCTAYSGNLEFCSDDTAFMVNYEEVLLGPNDYIFVRKGQKWAEPDIDHAAEQMQRVFSDQDLRNTKVANALALAQREFSSAAVAQRYGARLDQIMKMRRSQQT